MTHGIEKLGMLVTCLNCKLLWRRITGDDNPGGTVALDIIQTLCPNCNSNAWELITSDDWLPSEETKQIIDALIGPQKWYTGG